MKLNKEIRQFSREMLRASFTDAQLDNGKITTLVQSLVTKKPRHYVDVLKYYKRLLRLEIEKRHARIESAMKLDPETSKQIVDRLKRKYGNDLTADFQVDPALRQSSVVRRRWPWKRFPDSALLRRRAVSEFSRHSAVLLQFFAGDLRARRESVCKRTDEEETRQCRS